MLVLWDTLYIVLFIFRVLFTSSLDMTIMLSNVQDMYARKYGWMDGWIDGWMDARKYGCIHPCMHACMDGCMDVCMHVLYVCTYVCMDVWIHVYMHAYNVCVHYNYMYECIMCHCFEANLPFEIGKISNRTSQRIESCYLNRICQKYRFICFNI